MIKRYTDRVLTILIAGFVGFGAVAQDSPETFKNPILPGYHPDPSICRVGEDYYLVNSSFEWFPGMPIYHSKDLVNWELIGHGLHRPEQLKLQEGLRDYQGIYAVTIRHHDGLFYLITTCVDCEQWGNFYVTAENPAGPWSNPVWLGTPGIDPSLMWDDDGKSYYVGHGNLKKNEEWQHQKGAWLQEVDLINGKMVGPRKQLTHGHANNAQWTEAPHLYKINGKYLLLVAEGGTGSNHATSVHHSDSLFGEYVTDQVNPVLTHRHLGKKYPIHSVGHTDLIQTQKGDWWAVMLGKRFIDGYTLLARETFLCPVTFEGQTPIFNPGIGKVEMEMKRPDLPWAPFEAAPARDEFDGDQLDLEWNMLRTPQSKWYALENGKLILSLRANVLDSLTNPSLMARRIEHYNFEASLKLDFATKKDSEKAGMIIYRTTLAHYQLLKQKADIVLIRTENGRITEEARVPYTGKSVVLKTVAKGRELNFFFGESEDNLKPIGQQQDLNVISFEKAWGFNGPYVGMYATSSGVSSRSKASFDWFEYVEY